MGGRLTAAQVEELGYYVNGGDLYRYYSKLKEFGSGYGYIAAGYHKQGDQSHLGWLSDLYTEYMTDGVFNPKSPLYDAVAQDIMKAHYDYMLADSTIPTTEEIFELHERVFEKHGIPDTWIGSYSVLGLFVDAFMRAEPSDPIDHLVFSGNPAMDESANLKRSKQPSLDQVPSSVSGVSGAQDLKGDEVSSSHSAGHRSTPQARYETKAFGMTAQDMYARYVSMGGFAVFEAAPELQDQVDNVLNSVFDEVEQPEQAFVDEAEQAFMDEAEQAFVDEAEQAFMDEAEQAFIDEVGQVLQNEINDLCDVLYEFFE